jgi:hypothetical protein
VPAKGDPFTGPHLHATATDADDNTGEFFREKKLYIQR